MKHPPVRAATNADVDAVLDLFEVAEAQGEFLLGKFERERARVSVLDCLRDGVVILSLSDNVPVGTLGIERCAVGWWSSRLILREFWVFVHPEHRRAPHAVALLRAAKALAHEVDMPLLTGVTSTVRTAGKVRLFRREFGEPVGVTFLVGAAA